MSAQVDTVLCPPWPRSEVWLPERTLSVRHAQPRTADLPLAIFIHGLGGSSLNFTDLMGTLQGDVDGFAVDLGGFGWSPPPRDGDMTPAGHARSVAEFIEWLDRGPAHVFGNSLGGAIAVQLAARRPDLVRSLTLVSPALPTLSVGKGNIHLPVVAIPGIGEKLTRKFLQQQTPAQRVQGSMDLCYADPSRVPTQRYHEALADAEARADLPYAVDTFLSALRGLMRTFIDRSAQRPWKLAQDVTAPTLAIYGRKDELIDSSAAHKITKYFPNAEVLLLADSGHVAQMEHPHEVATAWRRFIAGADSSPSRMQPGD